MQEMVVCRPVGDGSSTASSATLMRPGVMGLETSTITQWFLFKKLCPAQLGHQNLNTFCVARSQCPLPIFTRKKSRPQTTLLIDISLQLSEILSFPICFKLKLKLIFGTFYFFYMKGDWNQWVALSAKLMPHNHCLGLLLLITGLLTVSKRLFVSY